MSDQFEQELFLGEFVNECREATDLAVQDILNYEETRNQDSIDRIFRVLHSIKGNLSMMGFMDLAEFVHKVEDACSNIRSGVLEPDKKAIDVLLKSFDLIEDAFKNILAAGDDKIDYDRGYALLKDYDPEQVGLNSEDVIANPLPRVKPEEILNKIKVRHNPIALVVDDDFASRKVLNHYLSKYMDCYVAKDGVEAIQAFTESLYGNSPRFDLIALDIMMPNIDGLQACKAIRQMERSKNLDTFGAETKIFIVSSLNDEKTIHKAVYECQADTYLIKPVKFEDLQRQLVRFKLIDHEEI
ncbi:response regulator [Maridesulfovibrio sp.]|uniref:ATP-binding response regulator n=1 Tax=Maridesulfovibrio sp. TaxID=2795000 RepID=UPI003BAB06A5